MSFLTEHSGAPVVLDPDGPWVLLLLSVEPAPGPSLTAASAKLSLPPVIFHNQRPGLSVYGLCFCCSQHSLIDRFVFKTVAVGRGGFYTFRFSEHIGFLQASFSTSASKSFEDWALNNAKLVSSLPFLTISFHLVSKWSSSIDGKNLNESQLLFSMLPCS